LKKIKKKQKKEEKKKGTLSFLLLSTPFKTPTFSMSTPPPVSSEHPSSELLEPVELGTSETPTALLRDQGLQVGKRERDLYDSSDDEDAPKHKRARVDDDDDEVDILGGAVDLASLLPPVDIAPLPHVLPFDIPVDSDFQVVFDHLSAHLAPGQHVVLERQDSIFKKVGDDEELAADGLPERFQAPVLVATLILCPKVDSCEFHFDVMFLNTGNQEAASYEDDDNYVTFKLPFDDPAEAERLRAVVDEFLPSAKKLPTIDAIFDRSDEKRAVLAPFRERTLQLSRRFFLTHEGLQSFRTEMAHAFPYLMGTECMTVNDDSDYPCSLKVLIE